MINTQNWSNVLYIYRPVKITHKHMPGVEEPKFTQRKTIKC